MKPKSAKCSLLCTRHEDKLNYAFISFTDATSLRRSHFFPSLWIESLALSSLHRGGAILILSGMANSERVTAVHRRKHVVFIVIMVYHNAYFKTLSYHVSHKRCSWGHKLAVLLLGWIIYLKSTSRAKRGKKFCTFFCIFIPVLWQGGTRIFFFVTSSAKIFF